MTTTAWLTAAGILLFAIAGAVFFFVGRKLGRSAELRRQRQAQATAEESAKRIVGEAEREAESLRKTAVLTGKNAGLTTVRVSSIASTISSSSASATRTDVLKPSPPANGT